MTDTAELNYAWAWAIFEGLVATGVQRVFISPGSRSTPLALAAARHPRLETRVILDERTAAFMALGAARLERAPVALVATSGTAVSEWMPAVTEADLSRVPLILLSADRPPELRHRGANQTIEQTGLFGNRVRFAMELPLAGDDLVQAACSHAAQACATALWPLRGPVHLNIPFREPLTPERFTVPGNIQTPTVYRPLAEPALPDLAQVTGMMSGRPGLIICGPECGRPHPADDIARLATATGAPVLADPLSNLRSGGHDRSHIINRYDACLRQPSFQERIEPAWVMRFGAMPVSKILNDFLDSLDDCAQILVDPDGRWADPLHSTSHLVQADPGRVASVVAERVKPCTGSHLENWRQREQQVADVMARFSPREAAVIDALVEQLPQGSHLFTGNSLPVRQLDWFFQGRERPLRISCNRGASGIDGNVATLLGMAATGADTVVGLLGDLTLVHDIGSLAESRDLDAIILVLDNGGGAIFDHLPQSGLDEQEHLFTTPRRIDLEAACRAFGLTYRQTSPEGFSDALAESLDGSGVRLLHIGIDRQLSRQEHQLLWNRLEGQAE
ncbi:MAG: 2-succinyl-5-enolpyruvyl-6-hydroxy-3-cyclohexene-1-carboxylic-acid synthase [Sedimenticola sp.]